MLAALIVYCCVIIYVSHSTFLRVNDLKAMTTKERHEIFTPPVLKGNPKHTSHDIHIVDQFGKFMQLSYEATHPDFVEIVKLDDPTIQNAIKSVQCKHDAHNTLIVNFRSQSVAKYHYYEIHSTLSDPTKTHYVLGSHAWRCSDAQTRFDSIVREIIQISRNDTYIIMQTKYASLFNIFQDLTVSFETNVGLNKHKLSDRTKPEEDRRRLGLWSSIKSVGNAIINGINEAIEIAKDIFEEVADVAGTIGAYIAGEPVDFNGSISKMWQWNYANSTKGAEKTFDIQTGLKCTNCYSYIDATFKYKIHIDNHVLEYLLLLLDGRAEFNLEISVQKHSEYLWTHDTEKLYLPSLSFSVAGFSFGVYLSGSIGIGISIDVDATVFATNVIGHISKGVEYNKSIGKQHYINIHDFHYDKQGPKVELKAASITAYLRPTMEIGVTYVGKVYFFLEPSITFTFRQSAEEYCPFHYVPSVKLTAGLGATMELFEWRKELNLLTKESTLDNLAGCITRGQITKTQTSKSQVTYDNNNNFTSYPTSTQSNHFGDKSNAKTYVDYSRVQLSDYSDSLWGKASTEWWGNLSTVVEICNDWDLICGGYRIPYINLRPNVARLLVSVQNDTHLIAIYHTMMEIDVESIHSIATNVSCISRHLLAAKLYDDDLPSYDVTLLESNCDTNLSSIGIDETQNPGFYAAWQCTISLPSVMSAISLDNSFPNIMLFDDQTWCHVFALSTKPKYELNRTKIEFINWETFQYPTSLFYGMLSCGNYDANEPPFSLYFLSFNHSDGTVEAVMFDYNYTFYLNGTVDLQNMTMSLSVLYWFEEELFFPPDYLTLVGNLYFLYDGTIMFGGSVEKRNCTGFLFQGYINMTQFDDIEENIDIVVANETKTDEASNPFKCNEFELLNTGTAVGFVGGFVTAAIIMGCIGLVIQRRNKTKKVYKSHVQLMSMDMGTASTATNAEPS